MTSILFTEFGWFRFAQVPDLLLSCQRLLTYCLHLICLLIILVFVTSSAEILSAILHASTSRQNFLFGGHYLFLVCVDAWNGWTYFMKWPEILFTVDSIHTETINTCILNVTSLIANLTVNPLYEWTLLLAVNDMAKVYSLQGYISLALSKPNK